MDILFYNLDLKISGSLCQNVLAAKNVQREVQFWSTLHFGHKYLEKGSRYRKSTVMVQICPTIFYIVI